MEISTIPEYENDIERHKHRFRAIEEDIGLVRRVLLVKPETRAPNCKRILGFDIQNGIIIERRIACRSIKGRGVESGIWLVYAYFKEEGRIVLIELYLENDLPRELNNRIIIHFETKILIGV